jgi:two-component system, LytTR family, response regulator
MESLMPTLLIGEREHRLYPLEPDKIDYIASDGNYVSIHSGHTNYISRDSLKRLAQELAGFGFVRIERSLLVNIRSVLYAETVGRGRFAFTLTCGACLQSSASYRGAILQALPLASGRGSCQ